MGDLDEMPCLTRRDFVLRGAASLLLGPSLLSACKPRKKTLNILNWSGYIADAPLERFEQESGIVVNYIVYFTEEDLLNKLAAQESFDLAVAPGYLIPRLKASKLIAALPSKRLPRLGNIGKRFRDLPYDAGLSHSVPYLWGTTGLGFNSEHFKGKPDSWGLMLDGRFGGKISMLDDFRESIAWGLLMAGLPIDSARPEHLEKARGLLARQKPLIGKYSSSSYAEDLSSGELWLAQAWNGDIVQEAKSHKNVDYVIPKEGSFFWTDHLCFVRNSGSQEEAAQFVDYVLRPDVAAEISDAIHYATPNEKAVPLLNPALRSDPRIFPQADTEAKLRLFPVLDAPSEALWKKTWRELRDA